MQGKGSYMPPAGGLMVDHFPVYLQNEPFVAAGMQRQLEDEQNINATSLNYLGISVDTKDSPNPSIVFKTKIPMTKEAAFAAFKGAKDRYETDELLYLASGPEELLETITGRIIGADRSIHDDKNILGAGIGALALFGNAAYGTAWLDRAKQITTTVPIISSTTYTRTN